MSSSTISKNSQLYSGYDTRTATGSPLYNLLYNSNYWIDASDTSTFTLTGTGIQQTIASTINDKSKNANVFSLSASIYYDEGNRGFALNTQYLSSGNRTTLLSLNNEAFFAVISFYGSTISGTQYILGFSSAATPVAGQRYFRIDTAGLTTISGTTNILVGSTPILEGQRYLIGFTINNGFLQHFINGKLDGSYNGTAFSSNATSSLFGAPGSNIQFRGVVHEMISIEGGISPANRQLIEYYLINKWKLPATAIANPTVISGCRLWLDASDSSSITTSGSSVTQWNDKSGFNNHATGVTSYLPTYTSGTPQINFTTPQSMRSTYTLASSTETIFVVMKSTASTASSQYFIDSSDTANGRNYRITSTSAKFYAAKGGSNILLGLVCFTSQSFAKNLLYCATTGSSGITQFINKTNDITSTTANTSTAGTYTAIGSRGGTTPSAGLTGSISEIVAYNVILSPSDRELVSNYLMNKWNITCLTGTSVNVYNGFQRIPPQMRYFTPNDIDNCVLWLDAADLTSSTFSGSNLVTWSDKSVSKYSCVPISGNVITKGSQNGLTTMSMASGNRLTISNFTWSNNFTSFIVSRPTSSGLFVTLWTSGYINYIWSGNNGLFYLTGYQAFDSALGAGTPVQPINQYGIFTIGYGVVKNIANYAVNGTLRTPGSITGTAKTDGTNTSTLYINGNGSGGITESINVAEMIMYDRFISPGEREQVEGYLARKWGISSLLPSTHTLKNITPLAPAFDAKSISSCYMWYDASDLSTITYASGSTVNVTNLKDKSGYGFDLVRDIYTTGREITTSNKLNGLTTLTFPGDPAGNNGTLTYMRTTVSIPLNSNSNYVFFVMRFNPFVLEGTTTARSWPFIFPFQIGVTNGLQGGLTRTGTNWTLNYNVAFVGTGANGTAIVSNSSSGPSVGTPFIGMFGKTGASQYVFSYNGTYETVTGGNYTIAGGQPFSMAPFYQAQELCEMIYYTGRVLSVGEIAKIDGYLAWKWGLQANLPSTHPYKKYAP